jgi:hypothetical protein
VTPIPKLSPSLSPTPAPSPTPTVTATPTPTPTAPAEVSINTNRAIIDFPNKISFSVDGTSVRPVTSINLEYGSDKRSLVSEANQVEPQYAPGVKINTSWSWEMKKTSSIPSAVRIWWQWRIVDDAGRSYVTPRQTTLWEDTRFKWQTETATTMDVYWSSLGTTLAKELVKDLETKLTRVKLEVNIPKERKPRIVVYATSEQIRSAILFSREWVGALAFPAYNIILIPVTASNLAWAKGVLAHEMTHLLVGEAVFGPFGDIPTWLSEGLAEYAEGDMPEYYRQLLGSAIKENKLLSVRSLGSTFPTDSQQTNLAYAQSSSLVSYLIDTYGWEKMRQLLAVFKEGSTYDGALKKVYAFDTSGLEKEWRAKISAG